MQDPNFIVIKQWVSFEDQQILFAHTRRLRERKVVVTAPAERKTVTTTLRVDGHERNNLFVVRKREKRRGRTTVIHKKKEISPSRTTVVVRKTERSRSPAVLYT